MIYFAQIHIIIFETDINIFQGSTAAFLSYKVTRNWPGFK